MEQPGAFQDKRGGKWIVRLRSNDALGQSDGGEYLPIRTKKGQLYHGGFQTWWSAASKEKELREQGVKSRYQICRKDENYRFANQGCGVIAMINLELYLSKAAEGRKSGNSSLSEMLQEDYEKIASSKWQKTYHIGTSYPNYLAGLYPWKMESGLRKFLKENGFSRQKVKWAPFFPGSAKRQRKLVMDAMIDMIRDDYPVVFAYYSKKQDVTFYVDFDHAIQKLPPEKPDELVGSHYMTVIGVYLTEKGEEILQVESWGRIYYVRYDEYARRLDYFSNILRIY